MGQATRKNAATTHQISKSKRGLAVDKNHHAAHDLIEKSIFVMGRDVEELAVSYDAFCAAADAFLAIQNQPRANTMELPGLWWDTFNGFAADAAERLRAMKPETADDAQRRAEVLIRYAIACGDSPISIAAMTCKLVDETPARPTTESV